MRTQFKIAGFAALVAVAGWYAAQAYAHHAFAAEFDADAPVLLRGEVDHVQFINPHSWIHVNVTERNDESVDEEWMVEGGTPNTLLRAGLNKNSLASGTVVIVRGYQSKDRDCTPKCKANGRDVTLEDGRKIFMGSSGTGAPQDGSDPTER